MDRQEREGVGSTWRARSRSAILQARPDLEISRADEIAATGTITTDIITRIMHSDYVIADVTYPNPNVFYELGLRHACRPGTIILKDRTGPNVPFDIAHLRYIDYEDTGAGLKNLATTLSRTFDHLDRDPVRPDSHLLELAKLTGYDFPVYKKEEKSPPEVRAMMALLGNPEVMQLFMASTRGEEYVRVKQKPESHRHVQLRLAELQGRQKCSKPDTTAVAAGKCRCCMKPPLGR